VVVEVVVVVRNLEKLRRLLSVGDKFPQYQYLLGGARMTSAVGFLQARSRGQGLVLEENE
jgi:hypothetical protein